MDKNDFRHVDNLTVNVPIRDLIELYNAVNEYDARSKSLDQMRREIEGLRSMMSEIMILIGELRKSR